MSPIPQRRTVLAAGAAGAVALLGTSCSVGGKDGPPPTPPPSPADQVRRQAARQSAELLDRYDATSQAHPALSGRLAALRSAVAEHLAEFEGRKARKRPRVEASAEKVAGQQADHAVDAGLPEVPSERRAALTALVKAERQTTDARTKALDTAPPEMAMLLASAAAAGAVHGFLLTELRAEVD